MQNSLVSVIIPAYQVENYIEKCVASLLQQTYEHLEILISCTASRDDTVDKCKKLAETDCRVRVLENKQFGVSNARNLALSHARGEYIAFVDADDWVEREYIQNLVDAIQNVQMSVCGFERVGIGKPQRELLYPQAHDAEITLFNQKVILREVLCNNTVGGYLWNKLFLAEIIRSKKLWFQPELCIGEDMVFIAQYIKYVNCTGYCNKALYSYRTNEESALQKMYTTGRVDLAKIESNIKAAECIRKLYPTDDIEILRILNYRTVRTGMWVYFNLLKCGFYAPGLLKKVQQTMKGKWTDYCKNSQTKGIEKIVSGMIQMMPCVSFRVLCWGLKIMPEKVVRRYVKG